jgi:hypothetical protein
MSKVIILAEGRTEKAIQKKLIDFITERCGNGRKAEIEIKPVGHNISEGINHRVQNHLKDSEVKAVIILTDLYPDYRSTKEAQETIGGWVKNDKRCFVHVAKHEFESWLLCDWAAVLKRAGVARKQPWGANPETINRNKPPSKRLQELFREGKRQFKKTLDGVFLFERLDLNIVAAKCPEFKQFINRLLQLSGARQLP